MFYDLLKLASVYRDKPNASEKIKLHSSIKHTDDKLGLEFVWSYQEDYANIYIFDISGRYLNKLPVINTENKKETKELNRMLKSNKRDDIRGYGEYDLDIRENTIDYQIWHMWYVDAWKTLRMYLNKEIMYPLNIQQYIFDN